MQNCLELLHRRIKHLLSLQDVVAEHEEIIASPLKLIMQRVMGGTTNDMEYIATLVDLFNGMSELVPEQYEYQKGHQAQQTVLRLHRHYLQIYSVNSEQNTNTIRRRKDFQAHTEMVLDGFMDAVEETLEWSGERKKTKVNRADVLVGLVKIMLKHW